MRSYRLRASVIGAGLSLILPLAWIGSVALAAEPPVSLWLTYEAETGRNGDVSLTKYATPLVGGRAASGEQVEVIEKDQVVGTAVADVEGEWRARLSQLVDGRHVLHARIRVDGETALSQPIAFIVDTTPPKPPTLRLAAGGDTGTSDSDGRTRYRRLPIEGRADRQTVSISVRKRGRAVAYVSRVERSWSARTDKLRPGPVTLVAVATDAAGNESAPSAPLEVEIVAQRSAVNLAKLDRETGVALWAPAFSGGCAAWQQAFATGDLDGDGLGDVVLRGTWAKLPGPSRERQTKIFGVMGSEKVGNGKIDLTGPRAGRGFEVLDVPRTDLTEASVVGAGDVDGDGIGDFAVLTSHAAGRQSIGRLTVVYGKAAGLPATIDLRDIDPAEGFHISGDIRSGGPFEPLLGIGDVNGDGLGDLMFRSGKALQVLFGEAGRTREVVRLSRLARNDGVSIRLPREGAGFSFAHGDVNGDGLADILVGRAGGGVDGTVSVVFGRPRFPADAAFDEVADLLLTGAAHENDAPRVASGFDLDGDGMHDIALLAEHDVTFDFDGKGIVVFGAAVTKSRPVDIGGEIAPAAGFRLTAPPVHSWTLQSAAGAGDVNGDGFDDLVLSTDLGNHAAGFLVYGRTLAFPEGFDLTDLDGAEGYRLENSSRAAAYEDRCTVSGVGDFNGDGLADMAISGQSRNRIDQPGAAATVVFGRRE